jgi:hypothetical protein
VNGEVAQQMRQPNPIRAQVAGMDFPSMGRDRPVRIGKPDRISDLETAVAALANAIEQLEFKIDRLIAGESLKEPGA